MIFIWLKVLVPRQRTKKLSKKVSKDVLNWQSSFGFATEFHSRRTCAQELLRNCHSALREELVSQGKFNTLYAVRCSIILLEVNIISTEVCIIVSCKWLRCGSRIHPQTVHVESNCEKIWSSVETEFQRKYIPWTAYLMWSFSPTIWQSHELISYTSLALAFRLIMKFKKYLSLDFKLSISRNPPWRFEATLCWHSVVRK